MSNLIIKLVQISYLQKNISLICTIINNKSELSLLSANQASPNASQKESTNSPQHADSFVACSLLFEIGDFD